jgi:hypothetical protein
MTVQSVLLPVFAHVTLTFFLMIWMGRSRIGAIRAGQVKIKDLEGNWSNWPERPTQIAAAYHNQFQLPVLFYVLVLIALFTKQADLLFVVLSWLFVVMRVIHAIIHTGRNDLSLRFRAFLLGGIILIIMWVYVLLKLFVGL